MEDKQSYPSDAADKVLVRMPDGMRDRLKTEAKANNRTMNAEIVSRLEQSFAVTAHPPGSRVGRDGKPYTLPRLAAMAGELHDLQGRRNSLSLTLNLLRETSADASTLEGLAADIESVDSTISDLVRVMQELASVPTESPK